MKRIFILDGMAIAYRAYFAFMGRPLVNSKGMNTSAIFGFLNTLDMLLAKEQPDQIAVAFDTKEPTFRHKEFDAYKATRDAMPEDMIPQLPYLKKLVQAYNIPSLELPGWEADDIIGTLAKRAAREGMDVYMVTPDKDYMQLVEEHIKLYKPGKRGDEFEIVGLDGVREKFGVLPGQVIEVLGLMGDTSDNIPGIKGVGEKTAIPLIQEYGTIEGIYENIDRIAKKGMKDKLMDGREDAMLSRRLATIDTEAPVDVDPDDLHISPKNIDALRELFAELEFKRHLEALDRIAVQEGAPSVFAGSMQTIDSIPHDYICVDTRDQLTAMVKSLLAAKEVCFDTETTGKSPHESDLVGLSFSIEQAKAWYVPVNASLSKDEVLKAVTHVFDGSRLITGQNLKFDFEALYHAGVQVNPRVFDTMIAAYILRPEGEHGMDALSEQYLNYRPVSITTLIGKGKNQGSMGDVPLDLIAPYAAEDADITLQLAHALRPKLIETGQTALLEEIEFPLVNVLVRMESTGIAIAEDTLLEISKGMELQIENVTASIYSHAGGKFNINSTKQLGELLFERLNLPTGKKTKTGYSTDVSVLESLQGRHPIVDDILLFRQLTKLKSTYVDALPKMVNPRTGRIHTNFNQTVAATGRLSSTDPNLQNIPIRTEAGREIRKAFVPGHKGWVILSADYSQIELRLAAEMSGDAGLMEAFKSGEDIHTSTAMRLFGADKGSVTAEQRRQAKTVNFGILYGISAFGLAQRLGISNPDAKDLIDLYFDKYPNINKYMMSTIAFAKSKGYVETLKGRRRYIPDINNKNRNLRMFAERTAINAPIQGTAADMIKIAMIRIDEALLKSKLRAKMLLQVHDELVFEAPPEEVDELKPMVIELMRTALDVRVPIEVEAGTGENWLEAH